MLATAQGRAAWFWAAGVLLAALAVVASWPVLRRLATATDDAPAVERRHGFVVREWNTAIHQTRFMDECPEGLNPSNDELWWRSTPRAERARITQDGLVETIQRFAFAVHRGPKGEDVCLEPDAVEDPPLRMAEGTESYGADLDGRSDGAATPRSCAHQPFTGLDGAPGVDNQLYRLLGCVYGWRDNLLDANANEQRFANGQGMLLVELDGVDDLRNDPEVTVRFERAIDRFAVDGSGAALPDASFRIDADPATGRSRFGDALRARIVDGVLRTERGSVRLPYYGNYNFLTMHLRDFGVELKLAADGRTASGFATGYLDVEDLVHYLGSLGVVVSVGGYSCPALVRGARELADGHPDPRTGRCTGISGAWKIEAVSAYVVRPGDPADRGAYQVASR